MGDEVQLTEVRVYNTNGNASIRLSVIIGNMNAGGTSVWYKDQLIFEGEINDLLIEEPTGGFSASLLKCYTKVQNINDATNRTVVTYKLIGGIEDEEFQFEIDVKQEGGFAVYSITFVLL